MGAPGLAFETWESMNLNQDGNVTAEGGKTFSYDSQNHLVEMNGGAVQMLYDGDGNRVAKSVNGMVTRYLVDDLNPTGYAQVMDELTNGAVTRTYTYGLQRISQHQVISNTWAPSFYSYDGGGNVRALTNTAGATTDSYEYDAFGNSFTVSGTTPNEMMYRGEQWDPDLGLYYLRARYYNPTAGRFVSMDPENGIVTDPATLHRYLYANGDPVNKVDPDGRAASAEYALLLGTISLGAVGALPPIAEEVNCILYTAADALVKSIAPTGFTLASLVPNWKSCSAKATYIPADPYKKRLFGTHWCGPGGAGPPTDNLDAACMAHDRCYDANGFTSTSNWSPFLSPAQQRALQQCNQNLCDAARQNPTDLGSSRVIAYFTSVPVGFCTLQ